MSQLTHEKLQQSKQLVHEFNYDVWLTFVRETFAFCDPILPLILEGGLTWQSALMVFSNGKTIAIVGNYDAPSLESSGDWSSVIPYVQDINEVLVQTLEENIETGHDPRIAINYSQSDPKADGLTYGMYLTLQEILSGTPFENSFLSAEPLLDALRGRKTVTEIQRIREAIEETEDIFERLTFFVTPGVTEREVFDHIQHEIYKRNLGYAWDPLGNPIVNSGPESMLGHGIPSERIRVEEGHIFHVDLGITKDGYSSDIQRCWFVGNRIPEDVERAFNVVNEAISRAAEILYPGIKGCEVDAVARKFVAESGYPEYLHAVGHQVGRVAHDGGTLLGPLWPRYGNTPLRPVEENQVYTLELGINVPNRGYLGLEEMVLVTPDGAQFLTNRQIELPSLG